jgi:hypothetical protein
MLALGVRGLPTNEIKAAGIAAGPGASPAENSRAGGGPISDPIREVIRGDPVEIEVSWEAEGRAVVRRAEDLVWNEQSNAAMTRGPWNYNGSLMAEGVLAAQGNGILASVISDLSALINNPRPGHENDDIWVARSNALPAIGTAVQVRLRMIGDASADRDEGNIKDAGRPSRN